MGDWARIPPHLRPLRRLDGMLQFGLQPGAGVCLDGISAQEESWLEALDGSREPLLAASTRGVDPGRANVLLEELHRARVLRAASRGAPAGRATVWISGPDPVGARIADLIRPGVGSVMRLGAGDPQPRGARPALVVLTDSRIVRSDLARPWLVAGIAHLPVVCAPGSASVGPLVTPAGGPCLRCVELTRGERDPSWPILAAQASVAPVPPATTPDGVGAIAAGLAAQMVSAYLDCQPVPPGLAQDVSAPWPRIRQYRWRPHPLCPWCARPRPGAEPTPTAQPA